MNTNSNDENPLETPEYEAFLVETAKHCLAEFPPCPGCCAGGICDGPPDELEDDFDCGHCDDEDLDVTK